MPVATVQATSSGAITLQGSAEIIGDLLGFGVNSILYQRMVYPGDSFTKEKAYGVPVYLCTEQYQVKSFIQQFVAQLKAWLVSKTIQRVVLVLTRLDTEEDIEKWDFNIVCDKTADENTQQTTKPLKEIQNEIRGVIRKIVSSVAILPNLREKCMFNLLAYTDLDCTVPAEWEDGKDHVIEGAQRVQLSSVDTLIHKVDVDVSYKVTS